MNNYQREIKMQETNELVDPYPVYDPNTEPVTDPKPKDPEPVPNPAPVPDPLPTPEEPVPIPPEPIPTYPPNVVF